MNAYDVAVVGGGPVGMWLAAELYRGGVRPVLLERRAKRPPQSRSLTLYPRTLEHFAMRGLVDRWLAEGIPVPSSHFGIPENRLDFSLLESRYPFTLFLPQRRTEQLLEEHLAELGVPILRRHAVTGLRQDETGVDLKVELPDGATVIRAAYVVGCDGAASVVRAAAGIESVGSPDTWPMILGDVELTDPPQAPAVTLKQASGSMYVVALGGGRHRLAVVDHTTRFDPAGKPVTFRDLQTSAQRVAGTSFGIRETPDTRLTRVGSATRQAVYYRAGRVLLAGDAAHVQYPAGGQGLNLGLQDATNLGWKLAAEVRGWAPPGLLDSYHGERHPVGLDMIARFNDLLGARTTARRELALRLSGLGVCYPGAGQFTGQRIPDLGLGNDRATSVYDLLHSAKFVLLNQGYPQPASPEFSDRLEIVNAPVAGVHAEWAWTQAILIRPDGYIAWASQADESPLWPPI